MAERLYTLVINLSLFSAMVLGIGWVKSRRSMLPLPLFRSLPLAIYAAAVFLSGLASFEFDQSIRLDYRIVIILLAVFFEGRLFGVFTGLAAWILSLAMGQYGSRLLLFCTLFCVPLVSMVQRPLQQHSVPDPVISSVMVTIIGILLTALSYGFFYQHHWSISGNYFELALVLLSFPLVSAAATAIMNVQFNSIALFSRMRESEIRYRHLFEYAPVALWEEDFSDLAQEIRLNPERYTPERAVGVQDNLWHLFEMIKILDVNQAAVVLAGAAHKTELLQNLSRTITSDFGQVVFEQILAIAAGKQEFITSLVQQNLQGEKQYVVLQWSVLPGNEREYSRVLVSVIDTTLVIRQARQLRENLQQRDKLIEEVHHRVRNSLATAYSILGLQKDVVAESSLSDLIAATMNRIQAIALVHTKLYENKDVLAINVKDYLEELVEVLSSQITERGIEFELVLCDQVMHIDQVLTLGILLNELATNSMKHAFPPEVGEDKRIRVSMKFLGEWAEFLYSDNGIGLPDRAIEKGDGSSLGMTLLKSMTYQLGASMEYSKHAWSQFSFRFRLKTAF